MIALRDTERARVSHYWSATESKRVRSKTLKLLRYGRTRRPVSGGVGQADPAAVDEFNEAGLCVEVEAVDVIPGNSL